MTTFECLIGLTGPMGSGKDTVADYLVSKYKFNHLSLSDLVRLYIVREGLGDPENRQTRTTAANNIREAKHDAYLMEVALSASVDKLVISGLYAVAEGRFLQTYNGLLLALDATPEIRYQRVINRKRPDEQVSYGKFLTVGVQESANESSSEQNLVDLANISDLILYNNGLTFTSLYGDIDHIMQTTRV